MFHDTMAAAIAAARTLAGMDELSRAIWQAYGSGVINDAVAQDFAESLNSRRAAIRGSIVPVGIPAGRASLFPPRRHPVSPDRIASRDRRRLLAFSGPMPPQLAARFTPGQLAVLHIVADEMSTKGVCALPVDAIAARAGVCRRLAQTALRLAEGDGLLTIQERRHQGRKNDANLVRIISREWLAWTRRGGRTRSTTTGCRTRHPTDRQVLESDAQRPAEPKQGAAGGRQAGPSGPPRAPSRFAATTTYPVRAHASRS